MNKLLFVLLLTFSVSLKAQTLKPIFQPEEYLSLLELNKGVYDSTKNNPVKFGALEASMIYTSKAIGLDNKWAYWKRNDGVGIISLRGTTLKPESWLANFYAAMVPAKGYLLLNPTDTFNYKLAEDNRASVHVGWLVASAYIMKELQPLLEKESKNGLKEVIIIGHSQGGALTYFIDAHIRNKKQFQHLTIKSYASAAPKPGNQFFAYEFDAKRLPSWCFRVVNDKDWVPQTPFSVQQISDFNQLNPFSKIGPATEKLGFLARTYVRSVYHKMDKRTANAASTFRDNLGKGVFQLVKKYLPHLTPPQYSITNEYVAAGVQIPLLSNPQYLSVFPDTGNVFQHHLFPPYQHLVRAQFEKSR